MTGGSEVTLEHDHRNFTLIFNETLASLKATDTIKIKLLVDSTNNNFWNLSFYFTHLDDLKDLNVNQDLNGNEIKYYLNKWYSNDWIENRQAYELKSASNSFSIHIKLKSMANTYANHRTTTITIWKEILPKK